MSKLENLKKFQNKEDIALFIENNSINVTEQENICDMCYNKLTDSSSGYSDYVYMPEYPDYKFCNEKCMADYLEMEVGIENEN